MGPTERITEKFNKAINNACTNREQLVKKPTDFTRNRKLGFKTMLTTIISMHGQSIKKELFNAKIDATNSAFVQARQKLADDVMETIFHDFVVPAIKKHKGYRVMAFDGSEIAIPYNKNSETYNYNGISKNGSLKKGDNSFHLNAMYDVLNKVYDDAVILPTPDERKAAYIMADRYKGDKAIVICDRGYYGYNMMEHFNRNSKLDFVLRSPGGNSAFKNIANLPMKELDVDIKTTVSTQSYVNCQKAGYIKVVGKSKFGKDIKSVTWDFEDICTLNYRVVRFLLSTGEYETLITSLHRDEWSIKELKELYNMRWGIETSFRELKYNIGLVHFHTKDEAFIKQEIFANLIAYNFCLAIAMTVKIRNHKSQNYEYRINLSFAIHVIKDYLRDFSKSPPDKVDRAISKNICPVRKNRADERKIKPKNVIPFIYRVA